MGSWFLMITFYLWVCESVFVIFLFNHFPSALHSFVWIYISGCHFPSAWRTSFTISYSAGDKCLLLLYISKSLLLHLHFWRIFLLGIEFRLTGFGVLLLLFFSIQHFKDVILLSSNLLCSLLSPFPHSFPGEESVFSLFRYI